MSANLILLDILGNPFNSNYYIKLANYYKSKSKNNEADALLELAKKYERPSDANSCEKPRKDD